MDTVQIKSLVRHDLIKKLYFDEHFVNEVVRRLEGRKHSGSGYHEIDEEFNSLCVIHGWRHMYQFLKYIKLDPKGELCRGCTYNRIYEPLYHLCRCKWKICDYYCCYENLESLQYKFFIFENPCGKDSWNTITKYLKHGIKMKEIYYRKRKNVVGCIEKC